MSDAQTRRREVSWRRGRRGRANQQHHLAGTWGREGDLSTPVAPRAAGGAAEVSACAASATYIAGRSLKQTREEAVTRGIHADEISHCMNGVRPVFGTLLDFHRLHGWRRVQRSRRYAIQCGHGPLKNHNGKHAGSCIFHGRQRAEAALAFF